MRKWMYRSTYFDLGSNWRRVTSFTTLPLYSRGKIPLYLLDTRLVGLDDVERRKSYSY
jgi:hypothetical protein